MTGNIQNTHAMNKLFAILAILVLASCAGTPANNEKAKRTQLAQYKKELSDLQTKIDALEKELDASKNIEYANIKVQELQPRLFEHFIEVTGKVEADQEVDVSPEGSGKIINILVKEGDFVKRGTVLATLNTDMLDQSIEEARISLELAQTTFERQENLWKQKIGSELQYLQAKSNKESLERRLESLKAQVEMSKIKAPVDGVVDVIYQKKGEIASPQMPFAKVVNIAKIKIYGDVAESYLTKIAKNDPVIVDFPAIGKEINTTISLIGNYIDPNNRTFRVRLNVDNNDRMIKPNMVAVLKIKDYSAENAIVIPSLLIKQDFKGSYTYIVEGTDTLKTAKKVYLKPGVSNNNMTEVLEGLTPGMQIISEGFDQVVDGTAVRI
jgi:RND family efflux transporter MFP subunit